MAGQIAMAWKGHAFQPANKAAQQACKELKYNEIYFVSAGRHRNMTAHRMYWALCGYIAKAVNDGPNPLHIAIDAERVSDRIKIATGHSEVVKLSRADAERHQTPIAIMPRSIAIHSMDGDTFGKFLTRAMIFVNDELCPWLLDGPDKTEVIAILEKAHARKPRHNGGPALDDAA